MATELRFDDRVALVTGAGGGLGRAHALLLASRGCKVVVNDLGGSMHGGGKSSAAADKVVAEIKAAGGEAVANYDSVEDGGKIVQTALDTWGRIDVVVNNAGILRDTSFQKLTDEDWDLIYRVHVLGSYRVTHAAWNHMREAGYGRIIFTASAAGIYGNFGQANYSMAKLGLVGLANTLAIEGKRKNILVNTIAPIAGSRLTETVMPKELTDALLPEHVSPLVALLSHESCEETGGLFEVGGGFFAKLRWERAHGKTFALGRSIAVESLAAAWPAVTDFTESEHPADITQSMGPVVANLGSKRKGGNEFIDVDQALGYEFPPIQSSYVARDLSFYALAVGAGSDPLDTKDLRHVYELHPDGFQPLPTFAVVPVLNAIMQMAQEGKHAPGMNYGFERILHGEQYLELLRPLPPEAKLTHKTKIKDIWDKGKNAVVVIETESSDEAGAKLCRNEIVMVVRGAGGWGGDRGPSTDANKAPDRAPDAVIEEKIDESQALLYRLSGDWNPLHVDPGFAKAFGFPRPILHGLCTFGFAARHVLKAFCDNDARYFKSIRARFAESVFPGETLVTEMWKEPSGKVIFRCKVKERDKVVIESAAVELHAELPKAAPPPPAAAEAKAPAVDRAEAAPAVLSSSVVLQGVKFYVAEHPELVAKIKTVYQIKLSSPESVWTIDLKNGSGSVSEGETAPPECTLELSDADFMGMASGKLNPQKLFFAGQMKIGGNMMAAQKLDFLQKVDPKQVQEAMKKSGVAAPVAKAPPPAEKPAPKANQAAAVFKALGESLANRPGAADVNGVLRFEVGGSAFTVDLTKAPPQVTEGRDAKADAVLTLSEQDLLKLTQGEPAEALFQRGALRVDGDVARARKLNLLWK